MATAHLDVSRFIYNDLRAWLFPRAFCVSIFGSYRNDISQGYILVSTNILHILGV